VALDSDAGLGDERLEDGGLAQKRVIAEGLDVKADRRADICERFFVAITLSDDDTLEPEGVGDVAVGVLLHDDLDVCHVVHCTASIGIAPA
jgi:hypothetical protein